MWFFRPDMVLQFLYGLKLTSSHQELHFGLRESGGKWLHQQSKLSEAAHKQAAVVCLTQLYFCEL